VRPENPLERACALSEQLEGFLRDFSSDVAGSLMVEEWARSTVLARTRQGLSVAQELRQELVKQAERLDK
jgi:hypothetical protein